MTIQGIIFIDIVGCLLLLLIVNLVRTQQLYVGYGIIWLAATAGLMLMVSVSPLLTIITRAVGALFPASALSLLAFVFIVIVLVFFSVKLTSLSNRQTELIQALALRELLADEASKQDEQPSARTHPSANDRSDD